mgnify:CR=1 FL=1
MRKYFDKTGIWDHATDKKNTTELKKIIKKYGWPTIPLVGKRASFCAWLLVQHADHHRQFQKIELKLPASRPPTDFLQRTQRNWQRK